MKNGKRVLIEEREYSTYAYTQYKSYEGYVYDEKMGFIQLRRKHRPFRWWRDTRKFRVIALLDPVDPVINIDDFEDYR